MQVSPLALTGLFRYLKKQTQSRVFIGSDNETKMKISHTTGEKSVRETTDICELMHTLQESSSEILGVNIAA